MGLLAVDVGERADAGRRRARIRGGRGCASRGNRAWIRSMRGRAWCPLSSGVIGWVQLRASDDQTARRDVSGRHGSGGPSGACYPLVSKRGGNDARKRVLNTSETRCANKGARHGLRWAEDRRRQGVAMHSPFEGMTAEETFNSHKATLRGLQDTGHPHNGCARCGGDLGRRARMDVAVRRRARGHPRDGFFSSCAAWRERWSSCKAFSGRMRTSPNTVRCSRWVLARARAVARRGAALELELAFCDYFDGLDGAALERIQGLTFRGRKNTQRLRCFDLEALLFDACGDVARRDEALGRIREMAAQYRPRHQGRHGGARYRARASSSASHLLRSGLKEMHGSFANRWSLRTSG